MKFKLKNLIRVFLILISILCLGACANKTAADKEIDENKAQSFMQTTEMLLGSIINFSDEEIESNIAVLEDTENTALANGLRDWAKVKKELGEEFSLDISDFKIKKDKKTYMVYTGIKGDKRNTAVTIGYDEKTGNINTLSFNVNYTVIEKLQKAAMNTLIGMGTVFIILIMISLIIYSLKFVNMFENMSKAKTEEKKKENEEKESIKADKVPDEENDEELIAVISAAIAAYENDKAARDDVSLQTDLIVRSIKRTGKRK